MDTAGETTGVRIGVALTPPEREAIYRLRYEVYIEELGYDYPAADHQARLLPDAEPRPSQLLYARIGADLAGTLKIDCGADGPFTAEEETVYQLDRFLPLVPRARIAIFSRLMTRPGYRSGDVARALLAYTIAYLQAREAQLLFCRCRPHLLGFYERLGLRTYAPVVTTAVAGILVPLVLIVDDLPYLERVQSPLLPHLKQRPRDAAVAARLSVLLPTQPPVRPLNAVQGEVDVQLAPGEPGGGPESIFDGIAEHDVARVLAGSYIIECKAGDRIVTQKQADRALFIVLAGTLRVLRDHEPIATIAAGGVCGEIAFLRQASRTADVIAVSESVRVLCIGEKQLNALIASEPCFAARFLYNLSRILARRLAVTMQSLHERAPVIAE